MPRHRLSHLDDPRLDLYRQIKRSNLTRWSGRFIAEGRKTVARLLESDFAVDSVLLSADRVDEFTPLIESETDVYILPADRATELVGYNFHSGVLACGIRKPNPPIDSLIRSSPSPTTFVVLPNVNDPENIGSIIRLAAGFGLDAVLTGRSCGDPFSRRALRVSMATALSIPVVRYQDLHQVLRDLRDRHDFQLIASTLSHDAVALDSIRRRDRTAILFGNEGHGLGTEWTGLATDKVTIPMQLGTDSLNVSMAAAVFLYQLRPGLREV